MALAAEFHDLPNDLADDSAEKRDAVRRTLQLKVAAKSASDLPSVVIHNLSTTGLQIETTEKLKIGDRFDVELPHSGATEVGVVWATDNFFGCEFVKPISPGTVSAALLSSPAKTPASAETAPEAADDDIFDLELYDYVDHKYPLRTRLLIIVGSAASLWGLIGLTAWGLTR